MDNLFLEEFIDTPPVNPNNIKEIQIHDKNNIFQVNNDNVIGEIDEYGDINTETIIHKQENISNDSNEHKIYDISSLFLKPITYHNILISSIENNKLEKSSNKMIYHLSETYSTKKLFRNVIGFRLSEFITSIPLTNINKDIYLYSDSDKKIIVVTVNKGYYTIPLLISKINTQISGSGTFSYDTTKRIVTYTTSLTNFTLYQDTFGILDILGFGPDVNLSITTEAKHHPNLLVGTFIDIVVDEIPTEACKRTCNGRNIVSRVPIYTSSADNDIIYYDNKRFNCNYEANNLFYPKNINQLSISLYLNNEEFNFDNIDYSFEFELTVLNR